MHQLVKNFLNSQRGGTKALLFFIALISLVFFRVIINQQTFFSDVIGLPLSAGSHHYEGPKAFWDLDSTNYMHYEVPQTLYFVRELQRGNFAFWNPYQGNGQPLSGSFTSGAYNPIKLMLFGAFPYLKTFDFYLLLRFLIAGFGTYIFLKKIGASERGSLVGGVAYMFSSYFVLWITHWSLAADMMTPYILLGIEYLIASPQAKHILFLGGAWGIMVLSQNPESVIVISLLSVIYFLFRYFRNKSGVGTFRAFVIAAAVALVISLPMLFDTLLFFSQSKDLHDAQWASEHAARYGDFFVQLGRLFHLPVSPSLFAEVMAVAPLSRHSVIPTYIGACVLLLVIAGLSAKKEARAHREWIIFFGGVALFFIVMWLGLLPQSWFQKMPLLGKINFSRYVGTWYFSLAVLAAIGFEHIVRGTVSFKKFRLFALLVFAPVAGLLIFSPGFRESYKITFSEADLDKIAAHLTKFPAAAQSVIAWLVHTPYAYATVVFGVTAFFGVLFFFAWRKGRHTFLLILLVLELALYIPKARDTSNVQDPYKEPPFIAYLKSRPDVDSYRIFAVDRTLMSHTATGYGLKSLGTYEGFLLGSYLEYVEPFFESGFVKSPHELYRMGTADQLGNKSFLPVFDVASVRYIVSEKPLPEEAPYEKIYDREVKIYENKSALPIARIESDDGKLLRAAEIVARGPNSATVRVDATYGGTLVLAETNYPGWRVFADGEEKEIITVHTMFRGVRLSEGSRLVVFTYWPLFTRPTFKALFNAHY